MVNPWTFSCMKQILKNANSERSHTMGSLYLLILAPTQHLNLWGHKWEHHRAQHRAQRYRPLRSGRRRNRNTTLNTDTITRPKTMFLPGTTSNTTTRRGTTNGPGTANNWPRQEYISCRQRTQKLPQVHRWTRNNIVFPSGKWTGRKRRKDDGQRACRSYRRWHSMSSRKYRQWSWKSSSQQHGRNINGSRIYNNKRSWNKIWYARNTGHTSQNTTTNHRPWHSDTICESDLQG